MNRYFQLSMADVPRWHLEIVESFPDGTPLDIWAYRGCTPVENPKRVPFHVFVEGERVDYTPTAFLATVVSKRLADLWAEIFPHDIQRIPASVDGVNDDWEVINVLTCIECIDHERSRITYYPRNHPEKAGKPRGVLKLVLDPMRIGSCQIFHPVDWEVATVVSENVKQAMEACRITGVEYSPVTE